MNIEQTYRCKQHSQFSPKCRELLRGLGALFSATALGLLAACRLLRGSSENLPASLSQISLFKMCHSDGACLLTSASPYFC